MSHEAWSTVSSCHSSDLEVSEMRVASCHALIAKIPAIYVLILWRWTPLVLLFDLTTTHIVRHSNSSLASRLLVRERNVFHSWHTRHLASVGIPNHWLLVGLLSILEYFLFDNFLFKNLIIKLQRPRFDQIIVEAFSISWLNDIALRVDVVLISLLGGDLMLVFKFLLLLNRVSVMFDKARGGSHIKLADATIIKLIDSFIESLAVNTLSMGDELLVGHFKLFSQCPSLQL